MNTKKTKGFALVEIIIGFSVISIGILSIIYSYLVYIKYSLANNRNTEAVYILEEGVEAITFIRDKGWDQNISTLSTTTTYYLIFENSTWATTTATQYIDSIFLRSFAVSDVNRDVDDRISDFGVYDPGTKKITVSVFYFQGHGTTTKSISTYISDIND